VERFGGPLIFARSPFSPSNYLQAPQPKTNPFRNLNNYLFFLKLNVSLQALPFLWAELVGQVHWLGYQNLDVTVSSQDFISMGLFSACWSSTLLTGE
jgi:hypothetical protein